MNKKRIIFISGFCVLSLGLWQFYFQKNSEIELLGPSAFDFTQSNQPPAQVYSEDSLSGVVDGQASLEKSPKKTEEALKDLEKKLKNLTSEEQAKFEVVEDILDSKNDNDPRLDSELKNLTPELKLALQTRYKQLPEEKRNERGLLLHLVARELNSIQDLEFIQSAYEEPPCMGLSDCRQADNFDPHMDALNQTTLDYPQKVGLYHLEKSLGERPQLLEDAAFKNAAIELLKSAENFPVPSIQRQAKKIRQKFGI